MKLIHNVNNLIDLLLILIVQCVIIFDKRGRRYIVRPSMAIPSNFNFELLGVLVLLLLTPGLMTRTLRVSILSHPKMSIGCCVDCCTRDTSQVRLALLHRQTCVRVHTQLAVFYYMKQGVFFIVCSRLSEPQ